MEGNSEVPKEAKSLVHHFLPGPEVEHLLCHGGHPAVRVEDTFTDLCGDKVGSNLMMPMDEFPLKVTVQEEAIAACLYLPTWNILHDNGFLF